MSLIRGATIFKIAAKPFKKVGIQKKMKKKIHKLEQNFSSLYAEGILKKIISLKFACAF